MKILTGPGITGTPIPRLWNPFVFIGAAMVGLLAAATILFMVAFCLVWAPFSILQRLRLVNE